MPTDPFKQEAQRKAAAIKLLLRGRRYYEKDPRVLYALMQAKAHSDLGDYTSKNEILKLMLASRPGEFKVDSEDGDIVGLTHLPTNFKIHTQRSTLAGIKGFENWLRPTPDTPALQTFGNDSPAPDELRKTAGMNKSAAGYTTPIAIGTGGVLGAIVSLLTTRSMLGWKKPVRWWEPAAWAGGGLAGAAASHTGLNAAHRLLARRIMPVGYKNDVQDIIPYRNNSQGFDSQGLDSQRLDSQELDSQRLDALEREGLKTLEEYQTISSQLPRYLPDTAAQSKPPRAADIDGLLRALVPAAALAGGGLLAAGALKDAVKSVKSYSDKGIKTGLQASGLPRSYPVKTVEGLENAYFITPDAAWLDPNISSDPRFKKKVDKYGGALVVGEKFKKVPVLLHEMGHAAVDREGGLPRFNQRWLRPTGEAVSAVALLVATLMNKLTPAARAALLGVSAAGVIPTLISEHQATARARQYMKKLKLPAKDVENNSRLLNRALSTYYVGGLAGPVAAAALLAYMQARDNIT